MSGYFFHLHIFLFNLQAQLTANLCDLYQKFIVLLLQYLPLSTSHIQNHRFSASSTWQWPFCLMSYSNPIVSISQSLRLSTRPLQFVFNILQYFQDILFMNSVYVWESSKIIYESSEHKKIIGGKNLIIISLYEALASISVKFYIGR